MAENADLSGLLASRICHDLVSPVGAITNGISLVREIGAGNANEEIAMIGQSATRASALLQYYRIAFGATDNEGVLSRGTIESHGTQMLATPKIALAWQGLEGPPVTRTEGRLLFQLLLCARAIAGMQGSISVHLSADASLPISINVRALGIRPGAPATNQATARLLASEPDLADVGARHIEFVLVHRSARQLGVTLKVSGDGESTMIEVVR